MERVDKINFEKLESDTQANLEEITKEISEDEYQYVEEKFFQWLYFGGAIIIGGLLVALFTWLDWWIFKPFGFIIIVLLVPSTIAFVILTAINPTMYIYYKYFRKRVVDMEEAMLFEYDKIVPKLNNMPENAKQLGDILTSTSKNLEDAMMEIMIQAFYEGADAIASLEVQKNKRIVSNKEKVEYFVTAIAVSAN